LHRALSRRERLDAIPKVFGHGPLQKVASPGCSRVLAPSGTGPACRVTIKHRPASEGEVMNWDRIQGNWKQVKGKVKEQWGKLSDDDIDVVNGRREQLAGKIQEKYGVAKDEAERQVASFEKGATDDWFDKPRM
jgi:uncharacterized protein YjbJ (UPF0337 family)